jgi:hypothetical protein
MFEPFGHGRERVAWPLRQKLNRLDHDGLLSILRHRCLDRPGLPAFPVVYNLWAAATEARTPVDSGCTAAVIIEAPMPRATDRSQGGLNGTREFAAFTATPADAIAAKFRLRTNSRSEAES